MIDWTQITPVLINKIHSYRTLHLACFGLGYSSMKEKAEWCIWLILASRPLMGNDIVSCINFPDRNWYTPLHYVCKFDASVALIEEMLKAEHINLIQEQREGKWPIQIAIENDSINAFNVLSQVVSEETDRDGLNWTERAILSWAWKIIYFLIR